nr:hypothetical protein [uncultured Capnocytophaga sp.]
MAKLQQMNEMSKQNSQILLQNGYVTYEGKRYNDCTTTEKEVFNIVIGDAKPIDRELDALIQGLVSPLLLQYTMNEEKLIKPAIFEQLKAALRPENDNDHEGWWHLRANCGCYTMRISGCYNRGVLNVESELYKRVGKHTVYYDLTNAQWAEVEKLIEKEYNRLVKEFKEDEIFHQDEINSRNNHDFI